VKRGTGKGKAAAAAQVVFGIGNMAFFQPLPCLGQHFGLNVGQHQAALRHGAGERRAEIARPAAYFENTLLRLQLEPAHQLGGGKRPVAHGDEQSEGELVWEECAFGGEAVPNGFEGAEHGGIFQVALIWVGAT